MLSAVYSPVYLKAVWETEPVNYTLSYNTNGGTITSTGYPTYVADGDSLSQSSLPTATKSGYVFKGWEWDYDKGLILGSLSNMLSAVYGPVYLKAVWETEPVNYTLSYNANGGSDSMSSGSAAYVESFQLPGNTFTRPKYTFTGWNTKANGTGTAYADNATLTLTEDTTLYAQWTLITDYTVLLPDGDNIAVDPETKIGSAQIGIQAGSTIPEDKQFQMSVNAGTHYDDAAQCYRLCNNTGGQLLFYALAYKGSEVNPGNARGGVLLETASSDAVFAGFQNRVSVTVGTARTAGRYTDTLTFRFALV